MTYDYIIIGAGAAGLMAASLLGNKGARVLLLEQNKSVGRKILISGGGKCNFTNTDASVQNYKSDNKHFIKSPMARYSPWDFIDLVQKHEIKYYEKKLGQLFCESSAKEIVDMLLKECKQSGKVTVRTSVKVLDVEKEDDFFTVITNGETYSSYNAVIASGGLSIPSLGANDFGYKIGKKFGHKLIETRPALVPFTLHDEELAELSGVAMEVVISNNRASFEEDILFTHKGLSGPGVLQISLHWLPGEEVTVNFLPTMDLEAEFIKMKNRSGNIMASTFLKKHLPDRFVKKWCTLYLQDETKYIANFTKEELSSFCQKVNSWKVIPKGTEGYRKAEVTAGGVSTDQISSKSMESQNIKGLYFIGEVVDVTGWLGGFNFQWAWASAHALASTYSK